ncbi:toprim domain-containing protein [Sphingomonas sp. CL5.1]|uniref:toprim domain-containing protein n=1 Tax=Sphingomonas sp. CL5.1 TaxID=2653203 RepID=UPI0034A0B21D
MGAREDTRALNNLTVQTVGGLLGLRLPTKGMARCPLPTHDDATPSFEVRPGGRRWICYGCNEKGGAIDLVMAVRGLLFPTAKRWLAEASGLLGRNERQGVWPEHQCRDPEGTARQPFSTKLPSLPQSAAPRPLPRPSSFSSPVAPNEAPETQADHELYAALLARAPLLSAGRNYLHGRSLLDPVIARFAVGQMPGAAATTELIGHFGFARVEAGGLLVRSSTQDRYRPIFPADAPLFPYLEAGQIAYLQARIITGEVKGSRWRNLNHRRRRLYNTDILAAPRIKRVAICEGAIDVLSAAQLGCDAIGLIGVSARLTDIEMMALRGRQVNLLLDWDEAGDKRAVTLRKELARFGVAVTRRTAPRSGAKDVNDYLREGNISL